MATSTLVDLVAVQVSIGGTGAITLGAAAQASRGTEALTNAATYSYSIQTGEQFEFGQCTFIAASQQITRSVQGSSNGNAPISVPTGAVVNFTALSEDLIASGGGVSAFAGELAAAGGARLVSTSGGESVDTTLTDLASGLAGKASTAALALKANSSDLAAGTGATLVGTGNGGLQDVLHALVPAQPSRGYGPLRAGANRAYADVGRNFYDPVGDSASGNLARIRPTSGAVSTSAGGITGADAPRDGSWWEMAQYVIVTRDRWKLFGDETARLRLVAQATYLKANYTIAELGGDGTNFSDGKTTINSLDDGGWLCLSLAYLHEATQDFFWLRALRSAIPAILRRFADPNSTPVVIGQVYDEQSASLKNFQYSIYGCQYDTGTDTGNNTASFEQVMAVASLYVASVDSNDFYLSYAQAYWEIENTYFTHSSGVDVLAIGLSPSTPATYLKDTKANFGYPQQGVTNLAFGGSLWMALLSAKLYERLGTAKYLTRVQAIIAAMTKPQGPNGTPSTWPANGASGFTPANYTFVSTTTSTTGVWLAMTDPFSDGVPMAQVAAECLVLSGVDANNSFKNVLKATAASIFASRTTLPYPPNPSTPIPGAYGADWGGALSSPSTAGLISGYSSYQVAFNAGSATAGGQQIMPNVSALSVLQAAAYVETWGANGLPSPVSSGYDASQALVTDQFSRNRPLIQITSDHGYDCTSDIFAARTKSGWTGDVAVIETACNTKSRRVVIRPEAGGLTWDRRMVLTQSNQQLACLGGLQSTGLVMTSTLADGAISVGRPSDGAAPATGFIAENLWFVHPGRLGYTSGALSNMLTGGQALLEICQGQAFKVTGCGGYGMPHAIKLVGCGGGVVENGFHYGGVYNPLNAAAQEAISQIYLADGTSYGLGHNINITVRDIEGYGGNTLGVQSRTIGGKTVQTIQQCGPRFGILAESVECLTVDGGFLAGYAEAAIAVKPSSASCVLLRVVLNGVFIDESNNALVKTFRENDAYPALDTLILNGCDMNGQVVAENGLRTLLSPGNLSSVIRVLRNSSPIRAVLGAGARMEGYDQYDETASNAYGYNLANNDDTAGAGLYTSAVYTGAQGGIATITNEQFGGGQNGLDSETNTVSGTTGLTPNGCMWGIYSANSKTSQALTRTRNLAKSGGGRTGGTVSTLTL